MFELYSVLRYHPIGAPEDIHYTATILEDGIWQIKGGDRTMFPTVEDWLQSLPGSPDPSMLHVSTKLAEQQKRKEEQKIEKVKKDKKKWNVPSLRNIPHSLPWARHIYTMIRECDTALLQRTDMRDAFNHLVQTLLDHNEIVQSSAPYRRQRYTHGITLTNDFKTNNAHTLASYVFTFAHVSREQYFKSIRTIYDAYQPLYALLRDTVVPFMEKKHKEICDTYDLKMYRKKRDYYVQQLINLNAKYEQESTHIREQMERYQSYMDHIEQKS